MTTEQQEPAVAGEPPHRKPDGGDGSADTARSRGQIERDIATTRTAMSATVDALAERLDVRARTSARVSSTLERVRERPGPTVAAGGVLALLSLIIWRRRRR